MMFLVFYFSREYAEIDVCCVVSFVMMQYQQVKGESRGTIQVRVTRGMREKVPNPLLFPLTLAFIIAVQ